jgi:hypothetical protein
MGLDEKDVATGIFVGVGEAALVVARREGCCCGNVCWCWRSCIGYDPTRRMLLRESLLIGEKLTRSQWHDVSSRKFNGMSRTVDVLKVMGILGRR